MYDINGKYCGATIHGSLVEAEALAQVYDFCNHPIAENAKVVIMPDCHAGKGCTVGFTAELTGNKIIPNIVGVDINCGILTSIFHADNIDFKALDDYIRSSIPSGMNVRTSVHKNVDNYIIRRIDETLNFIGEVDKKEYHLKSLGTLGGGNHYIEIGHIEDNKYALTIHTGSRNLGLRVCNFHQNIAKEKCNEKGIHKGLEYLTGEDFDNYISDVEVVREFSEYNRRIIANEILNFLNVKPIKSFETTHNYVELNNNKVIIRKGAISAKTDQLLTIPLNMRDGVIIGVGKGNADWNYSAPHGAGRMLSRSKAKEVLKLEDFQEDMKNVASWSVSASTLDEAPKAYKPTEIIVNEIKDTVDIKYIAKTVYNFKG